MIVWGHDLLHLRVHVLHVPRFSPTYFVQSYPVHGLTCRLLFIQMNTHSFFTWVGRSLLVTSTNNKFDVYHFCFKINSGEHVTACHVVAFHIAILVICFSNIGTLRVFACYFLANNLSFVIVSEYIFCAAHQAEIWSDLLGSLLCLQNGCKLSTQA